MYLLGNLIAMIKTKYAFYQYFDKHKYPKKIKQLYFVIYLKWKN